MRHKFCRGDERKRQIMKKRAYKLMKEWCDTVLSYKIETSSPYTDGATMCPACHVAHGRIADLCFPLTVIWNTEGDEHYLKEADKLIDWTEFNLKSPRGFWYNDAGNRWYCTTAFSALAIGEALYHFGDVLPRCYYDKWKKLYIRLTDSVEKSVEDEGIIPVSNYYCGFAANLAMAYKLTGERKYYDRAKFWADEALRRFDEQGFFYGEGYPMQASDGSHTIDMGYNMEESIPLLMRYASLTGEHIDFTRERMRDHLEFMLPDGAIDNSFGTRHNKWTYWGSRTSDGIVEGLALALDDPMIADACERALSIYEKFTRGGLLSMPMAEDAGEPTCLHHTFTHAKALAALVIAENIPEIKRTVLPSEVDYKTKLFQSGRLILASNGEYRATFSACRAMRHPDFASNGGGSMNLLYHKDYGVIAAATSAEYVTTEPLDQQYLRTADTSPCMTAQFIINGEQACKDKEATLSADGYCISAKAKLWQAKYTFEGSMLNIDLECENGIYNIPIVASRGDRVTISADKRHLSINERLFIDSSRELDVCPDERVFNQVGVFLYLPISIKVCGSENLQIKVITNK